MYSGSACTGASQAHVAREGRQEVSGVARRTGAPTRKALTDLIAGPPVDGAHAGGSPLKLVEGELRLPVQAVDLLRERARAVLDGRLPPQHLRNVGNPLTAVFGLSQFSTFHDGVVFHLVRARRRRPAGWAQG